MLNVSACICSGYNDFNFDLKAAHILIHSFFHELTCDQDFNLSKKFQQQLEKLLNTFLISDQTDINILLDWWLTNGQIFAKQLRILVIKYRNIGQDWKFTPEKLRKLDQYITANQVLVDCLQSDCVITRKVREEIEDTLLLPVAEIEKRKSAKRE